MAEFTGIDWTARKMRGGLIIAGGTWNPWIGCTKISPACDNCYAATLDDKRFSKVYDGTPAAPVTHWGKGAPRHFTNTAKDVRRWNRKLAQLGQYKAVFTASLADVFDAEVDDSMRDKVFELFAECSNIEFLVLTKRANEMRKFIERNFALDGPLPNVRLGVTVETRFEFRVDVLLETPAAGRFLSAEPLLGKIDILRQLETGKIDQLIIGGESIDGAPERSRPMLPEAVDSLISQATITETPLHFKQNGDWIMRADIADSQARAMAAMGNVPVHQGAIGAAQYCVGKRNDAGTWRGTKFKEYPRRLPVFDQLLAKGQARAS